MVRDTLVHIDVRSVLKDFKGIISDGGDDTYFCASVFVIAFCV